MGGRDGAGQGEGTGASELADEGTERRQPEATRSLSTPQQHTVTMMFTITGPVCASSPESTQEGSVRTFAQARSIGEPRLRVVARAI